MRVRNTAYPALMIFKEKHDDEIYIVNSTEDTHRLAVSKIRERYSYGYYAKSSEYEAELKREINRLIERDEIPKETAPRSVEALESLPVGEDERTAALFSMDVATLKALPSSVSKGIFEKSKRFQKSLPAVISNYARDIEDAQDIERIVHTERAEELIKSIRGREINLALWILDSREDHEYEGYSIEHAQSVPTAQELEATRLKAMDGK